MKISEIVLKLGLEEVVAPAADTMVTGCYTSDLLSDVMGNCKEGNIFITIQAHKNSIAVASLIGFDALIICNNQPVQPAALAAAEEEEIAIFRTKENQFITSGRIHRLLYP